jgi:hypothetical protein
MTEKNCKYDPIGSCENSNQNNAIKCLMCLNGGLGEQFITLMQVIVASQARFNIPEAQVILNNSSRYERIQHAMFRLLEKEFPKDLDELRKKMKTLTLDLPYLK